MTNFFDLLWLLSLLVLRIELFRVWRFTFRVFAHNTAHSTQRDYCRAAIINGAGFPFFLAGACFRTDVQTLEATLITL
jgi:hypothetical protein